MKNDKLNYSAPQVTVITLCVEKGICSDSGYKVDGFDYYENTESWE